MNKGTLSRGQVAEPNSAGGKGGGGALSKGYSRPKFGQSPPSKATSMLGGSPCMRLNADASPTRGSKRCLGIKIIKDHSLRHENTDMLITSPQIYIGLGKSSYLIPIAATIADDGPPSPGISAFGLDQVEMTELPYNGESQMRFMLTDGHVMVGYRDIDIDDETISVDWNGRVELKGRNGGSCGSIDVVLAKTSNRVVSGFRSASSTLSASPRVLSASGGSPQSSPPSGHSNKKHHHHHNRSPSPLSRGRSHSFAFDSDCSNVSLTPTSYVTNARSCHITIIQAEHLVHVKSGKAAFRPYVVAMMGEEKIRTFAVEQCSSERVTIGQTIVLPYTNSRRIKLVVADMSGKDKDPIIGTTNMNVDTYLKASPQRVILPIAYRGSPSGNLHAIIEFKRTEIATPRVMMTDFASPQDTLVPQSLILQIKAIKFHDGTSRQVYLRFRAQNSFKDIDHVLNNPISTSNRSTDLKEAIYLPPQTKGPVKISMYERGTNTNEGTPNDIHFCDTEAVIDVKNPTSKTLPLIGRSGDPIGSCIVMITPTPHQVSGLAVYRFYTPVAVYHSVKVQTLRIDNLEVGQITPDYALSFSLSREGSTTLGPKVTYEKFLTKFPTCTFTIPIRDVHSKESAIFDVTMHHPGKELKYIFGSAHINMPDSSYAYQHEYQEVSILNNRQELIGILHCKVALCPKYVLDPARECSLQADEDLSVYNIMQSAQRPLGSLFRIGIMSLIDIKHEGVVKAPEQLNTMVSLVNGSARYWSIIKHKAGPNVSLPNEYFIAPIQTYRYVRISVKAFGPNEQEEGAVYYRGKVDLYELAPEHRKEKKIVAELFDEQGRYCGKANLVACALHYDGGASRRLQSASLSKSQQQQSIGDGTPNTLVVEVVKVTDLVNPKQRIDTLDPYVKIMFNQTELKGHVVKNGGSNCEISDLFYFPFANGHTAKVTVFDSAHLVKDTELGTAKLVIDTLLEASHKQQKIKLPLSYGRHDSEPVGFVYLKISFISDIIKTARCEKKKNEASVIEPSPNQDKQGGAPAMLSQESIVRSESSHGESKSKIIHEFKSLNVEIINTINLKRVEKFSERPVNPYVVGRLGLNELRSRTVKEGDDSAFFGDCLKFPYGQDRKLKLTVWDDYKMGTDTIIGYAKVDIDQFIEQSKSEYYTCNLYNEKMNLSDCGTLSIRIVPSTTSLKKAIVEHHGTHGKDYEIFKYNNSSIHFDNLTLKNPSFADHGVEKVEIYPLIRISQYTLRGKHNHVSPDDSNTYLFDDKFNFSTHEIGGKAHFHIFEHRWVTPDILLGEGTVDIHALANTNPTAPGQGHPFCVKLLDERRQQFGTLEGVVRFSDQQLSNGASLQTSGLKAGINGPQTNISSPNANVNMASLNTKPMVVDVDEPGLGFHAPHLGLHGPKLDISMPSLGISGPHLDAKAPKADLNMPSLNAHGPSLGAHGPTLDAHAPSIGAHGPTFGASGPSLGAHAPSIGASGPSLGAHAPSIGASGPSFDGHAPKMGLNMPSLDANAPSLNLHGPKADAKMPSLGVSGPHIETHAPKMDLKAPSLNAHAPSIGAHGPSFGAHGPSLDAHAPSIGAHGPSFAANGPTLDAHAPSIGAHGPSFGAHGPTLDAHAPSIGAHGPTFGANGPAFSTHAPSIGAKGPVFDTEAPKLNMNSPAFNANGPSINGHGPALTSKNPSLNVTSAGIDVPEPRLDVSSPKASVHAPSFGTSGPTVNTKGADVGLEGPTGKMIITPSELKGPELISNSPKGTLGDPRADLRGSVMRSGSRVEIKSGVKASTGNAFGGAESLHKNVSWNEEREFSKSGAIRPCVYHPGGHMKDEICPNEAKVSVVVNGYGQKVERGIIKAADGSILLEFRESGLLARPCANHKGGHLTTEGCPLEHRVKLEKGETFSTRTSGKLAAPCPTHSGGHLLSEFCPTNNLWRQRYITLTPGGRSGSAAIPEPATTNTTMLEPGQTKLIATTNGLNQEETFQSSIDVYKPSKIKNHATQSIRIEVLNIKSVGTTSDVIEKPDVIEVNCNGRKIEARKDKTLGRHQLFEFPYEQTRDLSIRLRDSKGRTFGESAVNIDEILMTQTFTNNMIEEESIKTVVCQDTRGSTIAQITVRVVISKSKVRSETLREVNKDVYAQALDNVNFYEKDFLEQPSRWKSIHITVHSVHDLYNPDVLGLKMDPYLKVRLHMVEVQSETFQNAGTTVQMNTTFIFPYHNERYVRILAFDEDTWRQDQAAGIARLDLTEFAHGDARLVHHHGIETTASVYFKGTPQGSVKLNIKFGKHSVPEAHCIKAMFTAKKVDAHDDQIDNRK